MTVASPITQPAKKNISQSGSRQAYPSGKRDFSLTLFQVMIEAAKATSSLDDETHFLISHEIKSSVRDHTVKEQLLSDLERSSALDRLIKQAVSDQQKVDLYLAARLAVDPHKAKDSLYLETLKKRLNLDDTIIEKAQNSLFEAIKQIPSLH